MSIELSSKLTVILILCQSLFSSIIKCPSLDLG